MTKRGEIQTRLKLGGATGLALLSLVAFSACDSAAVRVLSLSGNIAATPTPVQDPLPPRLALLPSGEKLVTLYTDLLPQLALPQRGLLSLSLTAVLDNPSWDNVQRDNALVWLLDRATVTTQSTPAQTSLLIQAASDLFALDAPSVQQTIAWLGDANSRLIQSVTLLLRSGSSHFSRRRPPLPLPLSPTKPHSKTRRFRSPSPSTTKGTKTSPATRPTSLSHRLMPYSFPTAA